MPEASLLQAMDVFAKGVHRLCVVDGNGKLLGILTQSNVAKYLYSKLSTAEVSKKTLNELGLAKSAVTSINSESQVFAALTLMHERGHSSVPLVNASGHLTGSISMSDIKYVFKQFKFNMLWQSCFQFVAYVRNKQGLEDGGKDRYPVFETSGSDTLLHAMGVMCATGSHRLWVVDSAKKLCGVVSLTDALRVLAPPS